MSGGAAAVSSAPVKIVRSQVVQPAALDADARRRLVDELYVDIFDGVDRDAFAAYVVESSAERTAILVHSNEAGEIVGYFAGHEFHRELHGQPCVVIRGEAGLLRTYRGDGSNLRFGFWEAARLVVGAPRRPVYYLGCLRPSGRSGAAAPAPRSASSWSRTRTTGRGSAC